MFTFEACVYDRSSGRLNGLQTSEPAGWAGWRTRPLAGRLGSARFRVER